MADIGWGQILGGSGGTVLAYHFIREVIVPVVSGWFGRPKSENGKANGKSNGKPVETFAQHADDYWRNMDAALEKANRPTLLILEQQTRILEKLADFAAEERGARARRR